MKRYFIIILFAFLALWIVVIIISIYITRQNLRETLEEGKKLPVQEEVSAQIPVSPTTTEEGKEFAETKKQEVKSQELEFDIPQIPDEYIKGTQEPPPQEELSAAEGKLNKQPTLNELKELKTRGVIIY